MIIVLGINSMFFRLKRAPVRRPTGVRKATEGKDMEGRHKRKTANTVTKRHITNS